MKPGRFEFAHTLSNWRGYSRKRRHKLLFHVLNIPKNASDEFMIQYVSMGCKRIEGIR